MKIGIELRQVTFGASGGLAQHLQGMLDAAFRRYPQHHFVAFCTIFTRSIVALAPDNVKVVTLPGFNFFGEIDKAFDAGEIDVLFRSYPMSEPLSMPWSRQVVMIPDLQHEVYPEFFESEVRRMRTLAFNQCLARAKALIVPTDYVRKTIFANEWNQCRHVFLSAPSLPVGYGQSPPVDSKEMTLIPEEPFFLFPANIWPHKNHRRLLEAFEQMLRRTGANVKLVLTGHPKGCSELRREFPTLPIVHLGYVSEGLLAALWHKATALPFFSLHEGFGIPLLEAFASGVPVVCSNTTSLPEVGGDAVLTCDPTDVAAMSALLERILTDHDLRKCLIDRGKNQLLKYTWSTAATGFIDACECAADTDSSSIEFPPPPPLVSIVTPSYNQGRYLKATIDSILTQSYPYIEYSVFDGGSTDDSVDVLKSYGDRFSWKSQKDKGQSDAINQGLAKVKGQVVSYVNSDDILLPGAVEKAVDHFVKNPDADMVYGRAEYIDSDGKVTGYYKTADYSFERLMHDCCVCQPAAFWRSRIMRKIGFIDQSLNMAMDFDYWLRIDRGGGRIHHVHDVLAQSRLHADAKTLSARPLSYSETFKVCLRHGGYVDYNYYLGRWHNDVYERNVGWKQYLKYLPGSFITAAWMDHRLAEARRRGARKAAGVYLNPMIGRVERMPVVGPLLTGALNLVRPPTTMPNIQGLLSDNWMQPTTTIRLRPRASVQKLRHIGLSPVDMNVRVKADNRVIGEYPLLGGKIQAIGQDISLNGSGPIALAFEFSNYVVDAANRHLSFLVMDTNLFGEDDL